MFSAAVDAVLTASPSDIVYCILIQESDVSRVCGLRISTIVFASSLPSTFSAYLFSAIRNTQMLSLMINLFIVLQTDFIYFTLMDFYLIYLPLTDVNKLLANGFNY